MDYQDHIKHVEESEETEIFSGVNRDDFFALPEHIKRMELKRDWFVKMRNWFIKRTKNLIPL